MTNKIAERIEELKKGCGKDVFIQPFTKPYECGKFISSEAGRKDILCPSCQQRIKDAQEDLKIFNDFVEKLKEKFWKHSHRFVGNENVTSLALGYIDEEIDTLAESEGNHSQKLPNIAMASDTLRGKDKKEMGK